MKAITITVRLRRDKERFSLPVVAEHRPTHGKGIGRTAEEAICDLFTCVLVADAAERCKLPIKGKP